MPNIYVAVKAVIKDQNKYLIIEQKSNGQKFIDLPGGRLNYGEDIYQALNREVKEEVGLEIKIKRILGVYQFFRFEDNDQVVCICFLCTKVGGVINLFANPDHDEDIQSCSWLSKEELLELKGLFNDSFRQILCGLD